MKISLVSCFRLFLSFFFELFFTSLLYCVAFHCYFCHRVRQSREEKKKVDADKKWWTRNLCGKSSTRHDFLRDVVQCQVHVAVFDETQNWHEDLLTPGACHLGRCGSAKYPSYPDLCGRRGREERSSQGPPLVAPRVPSGSGWGPRALFKAIGQQFTSLRARHVRLECRVVTLPHFFWRGPRCKLLRSLAHGLTESLFFVPIIPVSTGLVVTTKTPH